ncbi:D-cysteine desulfhydrase family protein [Mycobacterium sp. AZCC_0083]|uniref:D-cysteine desulfhydrase family protein n=1 Tax=Mycobacterium sp. AZCC_0083 TaxID=2735882 RepID=UPI00161CDACE|nr:D-cysteine desulfhydrase family protein [Mycobacterium sp. AZCC_0083]MBB5167610.1 D-cysteine desulfhydrase [Mycobacterium sp. AZCC_0083]
MASIEDPGHRNRHVSLGSWPTPIEPAPRLAQALGLGPDDLWIKRDDLTGLAGGGNKIRKLEWTVGATIADGADTLVTSGAPQSNHARLTAAAGAKLGLKVILVFPGSPGSSRSGNLVLDGLLGAQIAWAGDVDEAGLNDTVDAVVEQLRHEGAHPAPIPFGGSSAIAAQGYIECARELRLQTPDLSTVVVALGSGATMAGLVAELGPHAVLGIDTGAMSDPLRAAASFATDAGGSAITESELRCRRDVVGSGYSDLTEPVAAAMSLVARTEGIILDPIYTGRAMAGLIAAVEDGDIVAGEVTTFLHTGGLPGLFGHVPAVDRAESGIAEFAL